MIPKMTTCEIMPEDQIAMISMPSQEEIQRNGIKTMRDLANYMARTGQAILIKNGVVIGI